MIGERSTAPSVGARPARRRGRPPSARSNAPRIGSRRSAQNRATAAARRGADRLRVGPERVVADLALAELVGPRLEDASGGRGRGRGGPGGPSPTRRRSGSSRAGSCRATATTPLVGGRARAPQLGRRQIGEPRPAALVERVEVAARRSRRRSATAPPRATPRDVAGRELPPVDDVADVIEERPVRAAGVRRGGAGQPPGGVVEAGPDGDEPIVEGGLVGPVVAARRAEVDRPEVGQGGPPEVDAALGRRPAVTASAARGRSIAARVGAGVGRRSPRAGRRARPSAGTPPRPPRTGRSGGGRTRARGAPPPTSRRAR